MSFTYERTVRFADTDAAGVVYFTNILAICHEAYEASLETSDINLRTFFTNPALAIPIVHASVDFLRPMYCGDHLAISLTPQKLNSEKFEVIYQVTVDEVVCAKAITRHICINNSTRAKQELPEILENWLENYRRSTEWVERWKSRQEIM
jgi:1,4-dihydroxy-2-naphthoyl-CoA hydrolase